MTEKAANNGDEVCRGVFARSICVLPCFASGCVRARKFVQEAVLESDINLQQQPQPKHRTKRIYMLHVHGVPKSLGIIRRDFALALL